MKSLLLTFFLLPLLAEAKTLKVMQYNGENFFDTKFDRGTEDFTYLPASVKRSLQGHKEYCETISSNYRKEECLHLDWSEANFRKKIINVSKVIRSYDESGRGPDIVVFQEIENANVLNKLVTKGLNGLGYRSVVLIEGNDSRGIDVGLISKFPVKAAKIHPLIMNGRKLDTRGILEVTLSVDGNDVVVFANHWPSQSNPAEERVESAKILSRAADRMRADLILAIGDFNTIDQDAPHPYRYLRNFIDAETIARESGHRIFPGTSYHKGKWNSLDKIFIHKSSAFSPDYSKFKILHYPFLMKRDRQTGDLVPFRFDHKTGSGYSDHLPVIMEFNY